MGFAAGRHGAAPPFLSEIPPMRLPVFIKAIIACTDTESSRYSLGGVRCESIDMAVNGRTKSSRAQPRSGAGR